MRNVKRERMARTILAVFVAWTLLFSGAVGLGASFVALAGEDPIEPTGDYNCSGVVPRTGDIRIDGNVNLNAGCVLTITDGGLTVIMDNRTRHTLNIAAGATLELVNSYLTVETNQIEPYLLLPVTVAGTFYGVNARLEFPGFMNVTGIVELWDSDVTSLQTIPGWVTGGDRFNDAPVFYFSNGEGRFYRTSIGPMLTSGTFNRNHATLGFMYDFNVTGSSEVWFVDSYLNIDYNPSPSAHNVLYVRDDSKVYAYNMSIDTSYTGNDRVGAIRTMGNGVAHILRWANVLCVDNEGVPIENVNLDPRYFQTGAAPQFPDSLGATPHNYILAYLGKTALTWLVTGPDGKALLPLPVERIDDFVIQTTPNSEYYGSFTITGTYQALTSSHTFSFNAYPAMDPEDGTEEVTLVFDTLLPKPDLIVTDIRWTAVTPPDPIEGENVSFEADITNNGATGANDVYVCFYIDGQPLNNTPTYISFIGPGSTVTTPLPTDPPVFWEQAIGDNHTVLVVADCTNDISESDETNNGLTRTVYVVPLLPDYEMIPGYISFPLNSYIGNPVQIDITVGNPGRDLAPPNSVKIFIGDPTLGAAQEIGEVPISNISAGSATQTFFVYTFDEAKDYKICVEVDSDNAVREEDESNNMACNILRVDLAPNLAVTTNDIGVGDPCTRWGQTVTPQAVVRNIGYVNAGAFRVDFFVDGNPFASGNSTGIPANSSEVITADIPWAATSPGIHVLSVDVDPDDDVKESTNIDNTANKDILVFHDKMAVPTYAGIHTLPVDTTFEGNIDITGSLTIDGKTARIGQDHPLTGRYCIKVLGTGSLILKNGAVLTSNYPLVIYVTDSANLVVDDSDIELDIRGVGGVFADTSAIITMEASILGGNLFSTGHNVSLKGVDLLGTDLYIETAETSDIWDTEFTGVTDMFLLSDDGDVNTVDFDIRNVTAFLEPALDAQLVFKGYQYAELTNVPTYVPDTDEWWMGMVTENAKVSLFWWLTVKMVDGTGAVLTSLTPLMNLSALDKANLVWTPVIVDANVPAGQIILRVLSQEMQHFPIWGWTNSTYAIDARVRVPPVTGKWFFPDTHEAQGNWTGDVRTNMEVELRFSGLTPDFSISMITFVGDGIGPNQPVNRPLQIQVTVFNSGNIASSNVEVGCFLGSELIGYDIIDVPAAGSALAIDDEWMPTSIGDKDIHCVVDLNNTVPETDEANNDAFATLKAFGWPDLSVDTFEILFDPDPVEQIPGDVTATIRNVGTGNAVNVEVFFQDDEGWSDTYDLANVAVGAAEEATVQWTPQSPGIHTLTVQVNASGSGSDTQTDYYLANNVANRTVLVLTLPDLQIEVVSGHGWTVPDEITQGTTYNIYVKVNNTDGGSTARNFTVVLVLDDTELVGQVAVDNLTAGGFAELIIAGQPISDIGTHTITAIADPDEVVTEIDEDNNDGFLTFDVVPPSAYISINPPEEGKRIGSGDILSVEGWVKEIGTDRGIADVELVMSVELLDATPVGLESYTVSREDGQIRGTFTVPDLDCGENFNFVVSSNASYVVSSFTSVRSPACVEELPLWVWLLLIIIIIVVVIAIAVTAYIKVFGLGKLVECGECGAFIPEDSTSCPKCGVQFETETAKCSNCQAWIPVKVKKCPECGVEFATGEVEMEDYKKKMRMQYDEVKSKFKKAAEDELGKALSDREFEDWWKTQPTFVTFGDWLKQEEDMRKMGSKPCPSCGTLNSVTATVCHKCGALMAKEEKARRPPARPPAEKAPAAAVPAKKEAVAPARPGERPPAAGAPPAAVKPVAKKTLPTVERPVPKKVVRKPVVEGAPTVVPKKVVKRPDEEEEEDEGF